MKHIDVDAVYQAVGKNGAVIIDVRTDEEYQKGHIEKSIHIPLSKLTEQIGSVISNKDTHAYLYCLSGSRSDMGAEILEQLGYTHIYSMTNGLLAWRMKAYPLTS